MYVDGDDVRMTLLEANEQQLFEGMRQENEDLAAQLRRYQEQLQQLDRQQASIDMCESSAPAHPRQQIDKRVFINGRALFKKDNHDCFKK